MPAHLDAMPIDTELLKRITDVAAGTPEIVIEPICRELGGFGVDASAEDMIRAMGSIPNPKLRHQMEELIDLWMREHPEVDPMSIAWALRSASSADERLRKGMNLELVWTGPAPELGTLRRTEQALLEVIESARKRLWLVSFTGYDAPNVRDAMKAASQRDVDVRLVVESPNESDGKVAYSAVTGLGGRLADVVTVYVWPLEKRLEDEKGNTGSLHVKAALADDDTLFVTSANLTGHAMKLNMELGILAKAGELPKRMSNHFEWLSKNGFLKKVTE